MKTIKDWLLQGVLLLVATTAFSQGKITGTIVDEQLGSGIPGVNITINGTSTGTASDIDGKFSIESNLEKGQLIITYIGFERKIVNFTVQSAQTLDLGSIRLTEDASQLDEVVIVGRGIIDLAQDRKTPIAVTTIKSAEIVEKVGSMDITQTMVNSPSIYVAGQAGGFGDSRIIVRGFGQDNTAFLLNGQPINGMEDGLMYWSNWSGMSDIANAIQIQRGLGSSKLAISSVGGTVNFVTKTTDKRESGFVSTGVGNDSFLKTTAAYNTGMNKNGFGMSVMLTHWQGDGYNEGTAGKGQNYFISFGYKPSENHNLNFLITGAPQQHDQNFTKQIGNYATYGRKYNNNWGELNGNFLTERTNFYHKPVANLNWDWKINDNTDLSTVLYASWGRGGGTGNYGARAIRTEEGRIDFDKIVDRNETVLDGLERDNKSYLLRSSVNNHNWYGLVTNLEKQLTENLSWNVGFDLRTYYGTHYRQVANFLGLNSWTESRTLKNASHIGVGAPVFNTVTESFAVNPYAATFNSIGEDQRIDYDNSERISYGGVFSQLEYSTELFSVFFQGAASNQAHQRFDRYDYLPEAKDSEKVNNIGYNAKLGGSLKINEQNAFYVNTGYYSRQPYHDNIYLNFSNQLNPLTKNEKILGLEAGYSFKSKYFTANVNAYRTSWKDRVVSSSRVTAQDETFGDIVVVAGNEIFRTNEGVEQLHMGLELDFVAKPFSVLDLRGFVSTGNWAYQGNAVTTLRDQDRNVLAVTEVDVDGGKVGDAAQFTAGLGFKYTFVRRVSVDADWRFYDQLHSNVGAVKNNLQLPDYHITDLGFSYKMLVGKDKRDNVSFRINVNNLLNKLYLSELRTNIKTDDNIPAVGNNPSIGTYQDNGRTFLGVADANQGFLGLGRTWNASIRYNF
jgi:iron complex outermembrane receptor protein